MTRSKLEKMSRYSANTPPNEWLMTREERDELWQAVRPLTLPWSHLTPEDVKTLYADGPLFKASPELESLRPALEYVFGDDDAMNRETEQPPF